MILIVISLTFYGSEENYSDSEQSEQKLPTQLITNTIQSDNDKRLELEQMALTNPLISGLIKGKLNIYVEPVPSYSSLEVSAAISDVIRSLEDTYIYEMSFERVYSPSLADIQINWIKDYEPHTLGEATFKSVVKVGLGATTCHDQWQPFDADTVKKVMWHEIGHSLGYDHSNNPNNIMYYQTAQRFEKDFDSTLTLDEGKGRTVPFCQGGKYSFNALSDDQSNGFLIYVLAPATSGQSFFDGQGKYYPSCSGSDKYYSFNNTCTVRNGASLLIHNENELLQFGAIDIDVTIVDLSERPWPDMEWDESVFEYDEKWLSEVWSLYH